jgi:hypothetical protein
VGNVFGRPLLGDKVKHNYVFGNPLATAAARSPFYFYFIFTFFNSFGDHGTCICPTSSWLIAR